VRHTDEILAEERCRELMEEDPHSARRRRSLQQEKAKLQELTARLVKLAEDDRSASVFEERMETPEVTMSM
jgi:succinate dehydrogenase/fumarate reductase flavoprotein subunit